MTQSEFDAELVSNKRSWEGTCVAGDLDVSDKEIHGDVSFHSIEVEGDLDLSGTIIHGSLDLFLAHVGGNLDMSGLKVKGKLYSTYDSDKDILSRYGLICVQGEILSDDLEVNGQPLVLPRQYCRVSPEDRELKDI